MKIPRNLRDFRVVINDSDPHSGIGMLQYNHNYIFVNGIRSTRYVYNTLFLCPSQTSRAIINNILRLVFWQTKTFHMNVRNRLKQPILLVQNRISSFPRTTRAMYENVLDQRFANFFGFDPF